MQKLVIKNQFMGVKPCEIEIRRFLLLIGEQASGKSTIAKLIYFFQTLPDAIYEGAVLGLGRGNFSYVNDINLVARYRFVDTFGPTTRANKFEIEFWYDEKSFLKVYQDPNDGLTYALFENNLGRKLGGIVKDYLKTPSSVGAENILTRESFLRDIYEVFRQQNTKFNYIISGRNSVVAYPDLIGEKVKYEIEKIVEDEVREMDFEKKKRRGNEMLFLEFVEWSESIRKYFRENGGSFNGVIANLQLQNESSLKLISRISSSILKGTYKSNSWGESLNPTDNRQASIAFKDASSGQQEVLRILQGLFVSIGTRNRQEFMIVEEPEAHLYPLAQKELINAFAVFLNTIPQGRLVITTHSPYILACINILLMASYVATQSQNGQREETARIVEANFWLNSDIFNAYSIGHSEIYCRSIKDPETGLIDQNYLDLISEQLGLQYQQLYEILS